MNGQRITEFSRDGLTFDVVDTGPRAGTPVVLLHGFPQRATSWASVSEILHAAGMRTLAPDQRGYSPRARPRSVRAYRINELVADVAALIDVIDQPVHVVGHDWGAMVAWGVAARHPDRVASLTAVSVGHPQAFTRALRTRKQAKRSWYMGVFSIPVLAERLLSDPDGRAQTALRKGGMTEEMLVRYRSEIVEDGALTGGLNWYRALPLSLRDPRPATVVPTTLVWSTRDAALGRAQAEHTSEFVTGPYEFVVLEGVSHWIPDERPQELAAAIIDRVRSVTPAP